MLYRKRTGATVSVGLDLSGSLSIQPFEGSRFVRGGRYGISIDFGLEVIEKESICGATFKLKFIDLTIEAQAHDRLIVTRDRPFCKTPSLESPMSLASGTRKRPPQSGFVQTAFWEMRVVILCESSANGKQSGRPGEDLY